MTRRTPKQTKGQGAPSQVELRVGLDEPRDNVTLRALLAKKYGLSPEVANRYGVLRRSIDARGRAVVFSYMLVDQASVTTPAIRPLREVDSARQPVIIVGSGPAGIFCAFALARRGIPSVVLERGEKVQPRRKALKLVNQRGSVDPESNYCFGEGGAGTYSDGKLYTRSDKRGDVRDVLQILVDAGATEEILVDARPHIGSNKLPEVVTGLRTSLEAVGVQFRFGARVDDLVVSGGEVTGVRLQGGETLAGSAVVLATGHSARDIYSRCADHGVTLEAKPFAVGVRIEHPQPLIDEIQYRGAAGHPALPAAAYKLAHTEDRGVFSFCMCPGGFIVPATTQPGEVVVNGMSPSLRNSRFANSGLVVSVSVEDLERAGYSGARGGLAFQKALETNAYAAGGGAFVAPAQRVSDFVRNVASSSLPRCSYQPGLQSLRLDDVLDSAGIALAEPLRRALAVFDRKMHGYASADGVLVGVETRTSAPVRIVRDPKTLQSVNTASLYPAAEGAGYAGGIVSAAIDGMRIAEAIAEATGAAE